MHDSAKYSCLVARISINKLKGSAPSLSIKLLYRLYRYKGGGYEQHDKHLRVINEKILEFFGIFTLT